MFRAENMTYAVKYLANMFGAIKPHSEVYNLIYYVDRIEVITFIVAIICCIPIFRNMIYTKVK